jgi:hypothetical protein
MHRLGYLRGFVTLANQAKNLKRVCSLNCVNDLFIILGNDPQIGLQID